MKIVLQKKDQWYFTSFSENKTTLVLLASLYKTECDLDRLDFHVRNQM